MSRNMEKKYFIGIDLSFIRPDHKNGGAESYIRNLMTGFEEIGVSKYIIYFVHADVYGGFKKDFSKSNFCVYKIGGKHKFRMLFFQTFEIPKLVRRYNLSVVFFPTYTSGLDIHSSYKKVVNPHDLQYKYYPEYFGFVQKIYISLTSFISFVSCCRIIAISEYVKDTLYKWYPKIVAGKVYTVYNPIRFCEDCEEAEGINFPYILSVNVLRKNKNLITLLKAYAKIADRIEQKLVLAGLKMNDVSVLEGYIEKYNLKDKVFLTGYVKDAQLVWLYKNADLFVTVSLYEGFGMTPVEAMGYGCPVISSKNTSLYEVTKGLAEYYEPATDENALVDKILAVLERNVYIEKDKNKKSMREAYGYRQIAQEYFDFLIESAK